jgi:hypothetical protein
MVGSEKRLIVNAGRLNAAENFQLIHFGEL